MNADEIGALVRQIVTSVGSTTAAAAYVSGSQLTAIAGGAAAMASIIWTIYANWKQRKVHETAIVTGTATTVAEAKSQSTPAGK